MGLHVTGVVVLLVLLVAWGFARSGYNPQWDSIWPYRVAFVEGVLTTLTIGVVSMGLSMVFGLVTALMMRSRLIVLRALARVYVELIRGTPLLVQILILFYLIAQAAGLQDRYTAGVLILSFFAGAYLAEIFRAGIESVGAPQWEAARAIGLTSQQTFRLVVLPQAGRAILPPLTGQLASLIKDSSLLSIISINEATLAAQNIASTSYSSLEIYLPLAGAYLLFTLPLSAVTRALEERMSRAS